jgi:hypothetical protein
MSRACSKGVQPGKSIQKDTEDGMTPQHLQASGDLQRQRALDLLQSQ